MGRILHGRGLSGRARGFSRSAPPGGEEQTSAGRSGRPGEMAGGEATGVRADVSGTTTVGRRSRQRFGMYKKYFRSNKSRIVPIYKNSSTTALGSGTRQNRLHGAKKKNECMTKTMPTSIMRELEKLSLP